MAEVKITQRNFNSLVNTLNHKVTKLEINVKWIKRVIYYMASVGTAGVGILGKLAFT